MDATAEQRIAALRAAVDGVLDLPLSPLSGLELAEVITGLEVQRRRLDAADVGPCVGASLRVGAAALRDVVD